MSESYNSVILLGVNEVQKPHLKGKPLYVATFDNNQGSVIEAEVGLRKPDPSLFVVGGTFDIEVSEKYGTKRLGGICKAGEGVPQRVTILPGRSYKGGQSGGKVFPLPLLHGDRSIIRQNSLAHATRIVTALLVKAKGAVPNDDAIASKVVDMARSFERYSAGDAEREAAEEMAQDG